MRQNIFLLNNTFVEKINGTVMSDPLFPFFSKGFYQ